MSSADSISTEANRLIFSYDDVPPMGVPPFDQDTLRFYTQRETEYTSLTEFFHDHGVLQGIQAASYKIISPERFKNLYEHDLANLSAFEIFELNEKVNAIAKALPAFAQKNIDEVLSPSELDHRQLIKEGDWNHFVERFDTFHQWAGEIKALDQRRVSSLKGLLADFDRAQELQEEQKNTANRWFSLRILVWSVGSCLKGIFNKLMGMFSSQVEDAHPNVDALKSKIQAEEDRNFNAAKKSAQIFRERASQLGEIFSQKACREAFEQSVISSWNQSGATHQEFLEGQRKAITEISKLADEASHSIDTLEAGVFEERWSNELINLGQIAMVDRGSIPNGLAQIISYLSDSQFPNKMINPYLLLGVSRSTDQATCLKILNRQITAVHSLLGENSVLLARLKRVEEYLTSPNFQAAFQIYHAFYRSYSNPSPEDFANLLTGRVYAPTVGSQADKEVMSAYRKMTLKVHPDKVRNKGYSDIEYAFVSGAMEKLSQMYQVYQERGSS